MDLALCENLRDNSARDPQGLTRSYSAGRLNLHGLCRNSSQECKTEQTELRKGEILLRAHTCFVHRKDHA